MRLLLPSLFIVAYISLSLWFLLPWRPVGKLITALVILTVSLKYVFYESAGGAFFAPALPRGVILSAEWLYSSLLVLLVLLLIKDGVALIAWAYRLLGMAWHFPLSKSVIGYGCILLALLLGLWGTWQGVRVPDIRTQEISLPALPPALDGLVIVQLSDLHIGPLLGELWLQDVVNKVNAVSPDLVVITGDIIDGSPEILQRAVAPLGDLRARYGVYGVTGNHEYYFGAQVWLPIFSQLNMTMLQNAHRVLNINGELFVLAGINDPVAAQFGDTKPDVRQALQGAPEAVSLLLAHQPRGATNHIGVDLQLSGHTHGGTLLFMKPLISLFNDGFVSGLYKQNAIQIHVSPGTGTWNGFSSRIGVPSEITRLVLRAG